MAQEERIKYLIEVYRNNSISKDEYEEFVAYLQDPVYNDLILFLMDDGTAPEINISERTESKTVDFNRFVRSRTGRKHFKRAMPWIMATAAVLAVLMIARIYPELRAMKEQRLVTMTTPMGEKRNITLPDGSSVFLNAGSKLVYPREFKKEQREVRLEGEAFFEVVHRPEHPFVVLAGNVRTEVLGTSFNIRSYKGDAQERISVATGKVMVSSNELKKDRQVVLLPNEQAIYQSGHMDKKKVNISRALAWKNGILVFEQTPLDQAAIMLERWYGVRIVIKNKALNKCTVTGEFYKKASLKQILENFRYVLDVDYEYVSANVVEIDGNPCH
ncbi:MULTISPECIES: FecR family protein [Galbibacter]|uniref:FecR domain-containing protein n=1 Tax=Galbibacter pacificus TaxID=2996052 RepID=A0ABT6FNM5_9FLAO|nr:FecR domain-containing protein [Galbibacter pacificus]MDG3581186.1 FecR domain-containing protein [Galbibacter pacificus]MDG3584664.1 FecR domain-containing protein [Galbibacter pacificus]